MLVLKFYENAAKQKKIFKVKRECVCVGETACVETFENQNPEVRSTRGHNLENSDILTQAIRVL